ncbi:MAG: hypothetical protein NVS4B11_24190 [Ktedonobacteraceae bacterium]
MKTRYEVQYQQLIHAVLDSAGDTDPVLRHAIKEQATQLSGSSSHEENVVPTELRNYITKVALHAYKITDQDIKALREAGYSEDAIFEMTLSIALGAGMARLERGLLALQGGNSETQEH